MAATMRIGMLISLLLLVSCDARYVHENRRLLMMQQAEQDKNDETPAVVSGVEVDDAKMVTEDTGTCTRLTIMYKYMLIIPYVACTILCL